MHFQKTTLRTKHFYTFRLDHSRFHWLLEQLQSHEWSDTHWALFVSFGVGVEEYKSVCVFMESNCVCVLISSKVVKIRVKKVMIDIDCSVLCVLWFFIIVCWFVCMKLMNCLVSSVLCLVYINVEINKMNRIQVCLCKCIGVGLRCEPRSETWICF